MGCPCVAMGLATLFVVASFVLISPSMTTDFDSAKTRQQTNKLIQTRQSRLTILTTPVKSADVSGSEQQQTSDLKNSVYDFLVPPRQIQPLDQQQNAASNNTITLIKALLDALGIVTVESLIQNKQNFTFQAGGVGDQTRLVFLGIQPPLRSATAAAAVALPTTTEVSTILPPDDDASLLLSAADQPDVISLSTNSNSLSPSFDETSPTVTTTLPEEIDLNVDISPGALDLADPLPPPIAIPIPVPINSTTNIVIIPPLPQPAPSTFPPLTIHQPAPPFLPPQLISVPTPSPANQHTTPHLTESLVLRQPSSPYIPPLLTQLVLPTQSPSNLLPSTSRPTPIKKPQRFNSQLSDSSQQLSICEPNFRPNGIVNWQRRTFAIRRDRAWLIIDANGGIIDNRLFTGIPTERLWPGIVSTPDSALSIGDNGSSIIFFKHNFWYSYRLDSSGPPRQGLITLTFHGIPPDLDAAFVRQRSKSIIFIKRHEFFEYGVGGARFLRRGMIFEWGIPQGRIVDAAVTLLDGYAYLIVDTGVVYQLDLDTLQVVTDFPVNALFGCIRFRDDEGANGNLVTGAAGGEEKGLLAQVIAKARRGEFSYKKF